MEILLICFCFILIDLSSVTRFFEGDNETDPGVNCPDLFHTVNVIVRYFMDFAYSAACSPAIRPELIANPMVLPGRTKT